MVGLHGEKLNRRSSAMGRFEVEVELTNNNDLVRAAAGDIPATNVRRAVTRGLVDTGATRLVLPGAIVAQLGLDRSGKIGVRYADGRSGQRDLAQSVHLTLLGRSSIFNAVVEPARETALIGAIVLEDLDFVVDCANQRLVPRDPKQIISEIE